MKSGHVVELSGKDVSDSAKLFLIAAPISAWIIPHAGLACPLRSMTGVPCPLCGMTTSVQNILRAHPMGAVRANPFGLVLIIFAAVALFRRFETVKLPLLAVCFGVVTSWLWELHRFHYI